MAAEPVETRVSATLPDTSCTPPELMVSAPSGAVEVLMPRRPASWSTADRRSSLSALTFWPAASPATIPWLSWATWLSSPLTWARVPESPEPGPDLRLQR